MKSLKNPAMNDIFILNASPIILLGKAGLLRTVGPLADMWIVPNGVAKEVEKKNSIDPYIAELEFSSKPSIEFAPQIDAFVAAWDLGRGESEVLSLALHKREKAEAKVPKVVLDDLQARKCAKLLDIGLIGSVGLLVMAKRFGLIHSVKPEIMKLTEIRLRIDTNLLTKVYRRIGE